MSSGRLHIKKRLYVWKVFGWSSSPCKPCEPLITIKQQTLLHKLQVNSQCCLGFISYKTYWKTRYLVSCNGCARIFSNTSDKLAAWRMRLAGRNPMSVWNLGQASFRGYSCADDTTVPHRFSVQKWGAWAMVGHLH